MPKNQILTGQARFISPGEMVLDPGPRNPINIDTTKAVGTVRADERAFVSADLGRARIGEAVADAGGALSQLAVKQMEAINLTKIAEAQDMMAAAESEMQAAMQQEPDETKWGTIASGHASKVKERIGKLPLSPVAKAAVDSDFSRWEIHRTGQVKVESARQSFSKAQKAIEERTRLAVERRDVKGMEANLSGAVSSGFMSAEAADYVRLKAGEEWKRKDKEAEAEAFDQTLNSAIAVASGSGEAQALEDLEKGKLGNPNATQKEKIRNAIQAVSRDRAAADLAELTDGIVTESIKDPAAIDALESRHLTPTLREQAKQQLRSFDADKARQEREQNGVRNAVEMRQRVKAYDPSTDPDRTGYFSLVHEIGARVDQSQAGEITGELYKKYGTEPPKLTVRPEVQQNVSKSLDVMFDPEAGSIPWRARVPVMDSKGRPAKDTDGNPRTTLKEDQAARQRAIDAQTVIEMKMEDWYKMNSDKVNDLPAVKKAMADFLPEGTRLGALQSLQGFMSKQSARDTGAHGDTGPAGPLDESVVEMMKDLETFIPEAYGDYKQFSVGYGTRAKSEDEVLSQSEADARLREELATHAGNIDTAAGKAGIKLTGGQRNALISFDFNTGRGAHLLETSGGDLKEVKRRLLLYTKAGGEELGGLVKRRKREAALFDNE